MSSVPRIGIYTGTWVDWSKGAILGSTLTLSSKSASIFTAFLAFFVTIVGACLWRILCFIFHQSSASLKPKDGMHHQHQLIFRNTASPTEAIRAFFESAFFWRKSAHRSFLRSVPLALFAIVFSLSLTLGSILSSLVAQSSGNHRLITSDNCGYFGYDNSSSVDVRTKAMTSKDLNDTIIAAAYSRACYDGNYKLNKLQCSTYATPALTRTAVTNASCPFDDSMCKNGLVYQLDTGLVDSHDDLGINLPSSGRIGFRKVSSCAPLVQDGYVLNTTSDGTDGMGLEGENVRKYNYGGIALAGIDNTTYWYNTHALLDGWGYALETMTASPGGIGWAPISELARDDADITLIFMAANSIKYYEPNSDPFFSANFKANAGQAFNNDVIYYLSDEYVNIMGCTDQYQYCHPNSPTKCTPLTDYTTAWTSIYSTTLGLNPAQQTVASRLALTTRTLSMHHGIGHRGASALRAQDLVSDRNQLGIRPNQWRLELDAWFDVGLARLQRAVLEFATGPEFLPQGTYLDQPARRDAPLSAAMCAAQLVNVTQGTTSFSVLGLAIIFAVGGFVVVTYLVLETLVGFVQRKLRWGDYRRVRWVMDDKLQVQRMAFEGAGVGGEWRNRSGAVPVTLGAEEFTGLEGGGCEKHGLQGVRTSGSAQHRRHGAESSASSLDAGAGLAQESRGVPAQMAQMPYYPPPPTVAQQYKSPGYQALPLQGQ